MSQMNKIVPSIIAISLITPLQVNAVSLSKIGTELFYEAKGFIEKQDFGYTKGKPENFDQAKRWLAPMTLKYHPFAFYTDCPLKHSGRSVRVDLKSCNYKVRGDLRRASTGEAEHIVPISWVYRGMDCSTGKSSREARSYCKRNSKEFNEAEGDLLNLQYASGEPNKDRAHFKFAQLNTGFDYGTNGRIYFDETGRRFMPPKTKWGMIGRAHLYMADNYPVKYSSSYRKLMQAWAKMPATRWECKYNDLVREDFGYDNPYTTAVCF